VAPFIVGLFRLRSGEETGTRDGTASTDGRFSRTTPDGDTVSLNIALTGLFIPMTFVLLDSV
jgi:hypothetical protein